LNIQLGADSSLRFGYS